MRGTGLRHGAHHPAPSDCMERRVAAQLEVRLRPARAHLKGWLLPQKRCDPPPPPPSAPGFGSETAPGALGGRGKGPVGPPREAAAERRGRGGAAPPPPSPNRVSGGTAARVSLRAEKRGPNSGRRNRPPLPQAAPAWRDPGPRPLSASARAASPGAPPPPGPAPGTHHPAAAPRDVRAGRSGTPRCVRRPAPEVGLAEPQLLPGDQGAENCARCPPLPPRRCHRWEQRRQSRVGRAGSAPFPPLLLRPPGRPPPAPRPPPEPGRKQPGKRGARLRTPRDPAFPPRGLWVCLGRGARGAGAGFHARLGKGGTGAAQWR